MAVIVERRSKAGDPRAFTRECSCVFRVRSRQVTQTKSSQKNVGRDPDERDAESKKVRKKTPEKAPFLIDLLLEFFVHEEGQSKMELFLGSFSGPFCFQHPFRLDLYQRSFGRTSFE